MIDPAHGGEDDEWRTKQEPEDKDPVLRGHDPLPLPVRSSEDSDRTVPERYERMSRSGKNNRRRDIGDRRRIGKVGDKKPQLGPNDDGHTTSERMNAGDIGLFVAANLPKRGLGIRENDGGAVATPSRYRRPRLPGTAQAV